MFYLCEIGFVVFDLLVWQIGYCCLYCSVLGQNFGLFVCQLVVQMCYVLFCVDLVDLVGVDGDGIQKFFDLNYVCFVGDQCIDVVVGQVIGFGKVVKVDQCIGLVGVGEQIMWCFVVVVEIVICFIKDQCDVVCVGQCYEGVQGFGWVFCV